MLKLTIHTSFLLTAILHVAIATEDNGASNNNSTVDKQVLVTSIYQSLYSAIEMDSAGEIKQFISFGADINHRYKGAKTPLMLASSMGSIDVIHALLELGANPNLVSAEDMTAMDYAKKSGDDSIIAALTTNKNTAKAEPELILIRKIQFLLGRLGYNAGEIDGEFGKRTKQSLKTFALDSKQIYPAEISNRQVETLKNAFFKQDLKEVVSTTDKKTNEALENNSKEEIAIIKALPLEIPLTTPLEISTESSTNSDDTIVLPEN